MIVLTFESGGFEPYLPEMCQPHAGVHGFELAHWLSRELARRNVNTGYPVARASFWTLEYTSPEGRSLQIGCRDHPDDDGRLLQHRRWIISVRLRWLAMPRAPLSTATGLPREKEEAALVEQITKVLQSMHIQVQSVVQADG